MTVKIINFKILIMKNLSRAEMKTISGGKVYGGVISGSCESSDTCEQGCVAIDSDGCSECSGCCIA